MHTTSSEEAVIESQPGFVPPVGAIELSSKLFSRAFLALLVTQFCGGLSFAGFYLLPKFLKSELAATASQIGLVTGVGLVANVVVTPLVARWLSGGQRRFPVMAGISMLIGAALGFCFVRSVGPLLLALRALQGLASALMLGAIVTKTAELVPRRNLGQAVGYVGLAMLVTNAIAPVVTETIAHHFGWNYAFAFAACMGLLVFVPASRIEDDASVRAALKVDWFELLDARRLRVLYAIAINGVALGIMFTFVQPLALERGARDVSRLFLGYVVTAASVRVILGHVADRLGKRRVSTVFFGLYAVVVAASAALTPSSLFLLGLGFGVTHGILYPALSALALDQATDRGRGLAASATNGTFSLGFAASVLLLGIVADHHGYPAAFLAGACWITTAIPVLGWSRR